MLIQCPCPDFSARWLYNNTALVSPEALQPQDHFLESARCPNRRRRGLLRRGLFLRLLVHLDLVSIRVQRRWAQRLAAMTSISTRESRGRRATCTVLRAG